MKIRVEVQVGAYDNADLQKTMDMDFARLSQPSQEVLRWALEQVAKDFTLVRTHRLATGEPHILEFVAEIKGV